MKKFVGAIILAGAVLVPSAAMADSTVVIGGVVAGATGSTTGTSPATGSTATTPPDDIPVLPPLTPAQAKKAEHEAAEQAKKQAEEQKRAEHEAAEQAKREAHADHEEHGPQNVAPSADKSGSSSVWEDPSLIHNGGWKLS
jgi:hypothetical protein